MTVHSNTSRITSAAFSTELIASNFSYPLSPDLHSLKIWLWMLTQTQTYTETNYISLTTAFICLEVTELQRGSDAYFLRKEGRDLTEVTAKEHLTSSPPD